MDATKTRIGRDDALKLLDGVEKLVAAKGKKIEVFDLRCLSPLDLSQIVPAVAKTGRLIVLHEGRKTHGFGAEIVARITEGARVPLKAPPLRIAAMDLPVPFAHELEAAFRPSKDGVIELITGWMS